jgi:Tfp pilus assembly protein PilZ
MASEIENRQHPRMPITLPARMVTAIGVMEGETENVSLHGAFIRCQKPLEPGERLIVIVKLPSNPSFNSPAEVVWSRVSRPNDEGTGPGMGVKFID